MVHHLDAGNMFGFVTAVAATSIPIREVFLVADVLYARLHGSEMLQRQKCFSACQPHLLQ